MAWIYVFLIILSCILLHHVFLKKKVHLGVPGPKGIPIFGNVLQLESSHLYLQFTKWSKQYGPVFGLNLAGTPTVVVSGRAALYEVLVTNGKDFSGRMQNFRFDVYSKLLGFAELSPIIAHQKKMIMGHLKAYGSGFREIENIVMREMDSLKNNLEQKCEDGKAILQLNDHIENCVARISSIFMFGDDVDEQDITEMTNIAVSINETMSPSFMGQMLDALPWLRFLGHPIWKKMSNNIININKTYRRFKTRIHTHKKQGKDMSGNFLSKYLDIYEGDNHLGIEEEHCAMSPIALFGVALDTTTRTLNILCANIILQPSVQDELQKESDEMLKGRPVTVKDRIDMPYHHAVILEITRMYPIVPMAIPHRALCDSEIAGYQIPKDTIIFSNIWALHHDETVWEKPLLFKPERYLDDEGKLVPADHPARENHLAFSAGPRVCAGESMATARMFLILATLIQNFELLPATSPEEQPPCGCYDMIDGIVISPPPYSARLKPRKLNIQSR